MRLFSFRWHPYMVEPGMDPAAEPMTLVEFQFEEGVGGTHLAITESGFRPRSARAARGSLRCQRAGWREQATLLA